MENFEQSWQRNHHCDVRDFLPADLNSDSQRVAIELLCVDMHYRWQRGERKTAAEYRQEFPHIVRDRDALGELALEEFRIANLSGIRVPADVLAGKYALDTIGWPTVGNDAGSVATCRWDRDLDQILAAAHTFPQPGESLGDFELIEVLGKGTFAIVYLARQPGLANREVALKVSLAGSIEPENLARLQHAHIVPIHSLHRHGGFQVICMPYFGRGTLDKLLRDPHRRPPENAGAMNHCLRLLQQMVAGLVHAHRRGILHRDLKPANVLLADDGTAMLLDFNLSEDMAAGGEANLMVGGTLPYLCTEQLRSLLDGGRVDERADLFSCGVILYELLTGVLPFPVRSGPFDQCIAAMISDRMAGAVPGAKPNTTLPPSISGMLARLLAARPADRYASAEQLAADLERHFANLPLQFAPDKSPRERVGKFARRHPRWFSGSSVALVAAIWIALLSVLVLSTRHRLERSHAVQQLRDALDQLAAVRSVLVNPVLDAPSVAGATASAREIVQRYRADAEGWDTSRLVAPLSDRQRATLRQCVADYAFLLASVELRQAMKATDDAARRRLLETARSDNQRARVALARNAAPGDALQWQSRSIESALRGEPYDPSGGSYLASPDIAQPWREAMYLLEQADYQDAIPPLERLRDFAPHDPSVWLLLGNAYAGVERYEQAEHCFTVSVSMWPDSVAGRYHRGLCRLDRNQFRAGEADFSACIRLRADYIPAWISRSAVRQQLAAAAGDPVMLRPPRRT